MNYNALCCVPSLAGFRGVSGVGVGRDALEGASKPAPEAVRQAVGGGFQRGWGRLLSATDAIEAGTCRPAYA